MKGYKTIWTVLFICISLICTSTYWIWASNLKHPGHADPSFYVEMANSINNTGSFKGDYIWHFFHKPDGISHYAFDYWLPGTSLIQAVFILVTNDPLLGASLAGFIFLIVLTTIIYHSMRLFRFDKYISFIASAALYAYLVPIFMNLYTTPFYLFFGSVSLLMLGFYLHTHKSYYLYVCFLMAALGYWIRGDALLLLPFSVIAVWLYADDPKKYRKLLVGGSVYVTGLLPLIILNSYHGNFILPPSWKAFYLTGYTDLYAYWPNESFADLLQSTSFSSYLKNHVQAGFDKIIELFEGKPYIIVSILPVAWLFTHYIKNQTWPKRLMLASFCIVTYALLTFLFYLLFIPYYRSAILLSTTIASIGVFLMLFLMASKWFGKTTALITIMIFAFLGLGASLDEMNETGHRLEKTYSHLCQKIHKYRDDPVVMTRQVWDLSYECDVPLVQTPSDGIKAVNAAIKKYDINLLLIENSWLNLRPSIKKISELKIFKKSGIVFELVWKNRNGANSLYKITH